MTNALKDSASPYLRQHADNPVDWWPWGEAAFAEARRRDVPVLVSIGYATCHWCHVMAHECFESADIAAQMNRHYVNIKVDREELPEVDEIYMDAVQALTGRGGWPLNAFVDHDGRPFFAGTYFPPAKWRGLLAQLSDLWVTDRARIEEAAQELHDHLATTNADETHGELGDLHDHLSRRVTERFDELHPGLGRAPKFPPAQLLLWLVEAGAAVEGGSPKAIAILEAMQDAGLHDRIGGGFHRYSTDRVWRVPHFEKMLYDNAQLAVAYAIAGAKTGRADFSRTAVGIGDYLLRDLRVVAADGAFIGYASAEDADDSGDPSAHGCREGGYYAVEPELLGTIVGADAAARLTASWDLSPGVPRLGPSGHVEPAASVIPHPRAVDLAAVAKTYGFETIEALRVSWEEHLPTLRASRDQTRRPIRDDKVLTDLNGLALAALATLGRLAPDLKTRERFTTATRELAAALSDCHPIAGLLRLRGAAPRPAFVTDYGLCALGLLEAWRLLGDPSLVARAQAVVAEANARLSAPDGGFFTTPSGRGDLIRRSREKGDGPYPAGQHALALANARLYVITGDESFRRRADAVISSQSALLARAPEACPTLGLAWHERKAEVTIVVVAGAGPEADAMLATVRGLAGLGAWPVAADAHRDFGWATLDGRESDTAKAWVCVGTRCLLPVNDASALAASLATLSAG